MEPPQYQQFNNLIINLHGFTPHELFQLNDDPTIFNPKIKNNKCQEKDSSNQGRIQHYVFGVVKIILLNFFIQLD